MRILDYNGDRIDKTYVNIIDIDRAGHLSFGFEIIEDFKLPSADRLVGITQNNRIYTPLYEISLFEKSKEIRIEGEHIEEDEVLNLVNKARIIGLDVEMERRGETVYILIGDTQTIYNTSKLPLTLISSTEVEAVESANNLYIKNVKLPAFCKWLFAGTKWDKLDLDIDDKEVVSYEYFFMNCILGNIVLDKFTCKNVVTMLNFMKGATANRIDFSNKEFSNIVDMSGAFEDIKVKEDLRLDNLTLSNDFNKQINMQRFIYGGNIDGNLSIENMYLASPIKAYSLASGCVINRDMHMNNLVVSRGSLLDKLLCAIVIKGNLEINNWEIEDGVRIVSSLLGNNVDVHGTLNLTNLNINSNNITILNIVRADALNLVGYREKEAEGVNKRFKSVRVNKLIVDSNFPKEYIEEIEAKEVEIR